MKTEKGREKGSEKSGSGEVRLAFAEETWAKIQELLGEKKKGPPRGRPRAGARRSLEAAVWKFLSAKPWAELPSGFGSRSTAHRHFQRWAKRGGLERLRRWVLRRLKNPGGNRRELPPCLLLAKALNRGFQGAWKKGKC